MLAVPRAGGRRRLEVPALRCGADLARHLMNVRALPAPLRFSWRPLRLALYGVGVLVILLNARLVADDAAVALAFARAGFDYDVLTEAARLDNPYHQPWYVWSPVAVYPLRLLEVIGNPAWTALHFVALVPLGWPLGAVVGLSWPFWHDMVAGNVIVFVAVAGLLSLRGSRTATVAFMVMALLMPRPLMAPLIVWHLWRQPWTRGVFGALFAAHAIAVLATGHAGDWAARMADPPFVMENPGNLTGLLGWAWWPIGATISVVAFRYGHLGLASVAIQPYIFPQYLMMLLLELCQPKDGSTRSAESRTPASSSHPPPY